MKKVIYVFNLVIAGLFALIVLYLVSFNIAEPALSPTLEIKALGENINQEDSTLNLVSYQIPSALDDSNLKAASYKVVDLNDGSIITKNHTDIPLPIASLTKLMTAWVTLQYGSLQDDYTIQAKDVELTSPSLSLKKGDAVLVSDLVNAMLIGSANDAANSLGGYLEQKTNKKITELMNEQAGKLGMSSSRYSNPIGFDSNTNYSSADDIEILVKKLLETGIFEQTSKKSGYVFQSQQYNSYQISATNKLIQKYSDLYAIKTGFTNTALGSMVNIVKNGEKSYLLIVISSPDREADTLELRNLVINR